MTDSQSHQMDQEVIIFEEEQVLWAKIRGYPWWPAFVDKVHGANNQQETQYTVFFFGDNTQYFLDQEAPNCADLLTFTASFFQNLKLTETQQKLKQNGGNVQIFEKLRNALKKPKKIKGNHRTQSKIGSQQPQNLQNQHLDMPQLGRNKTFPFKQSMKQQNQQLLQKQSFDLQKIPKKRGRKPKKQAKYQSQKQQQQQSKNQQGQQNINQNQNNLQQQSSSSHIQQQNKLGYRTRLRRVSRRSQIQKVLQQAQKQKIQQSEQKDQQQQQSQNQGKYQKQYPLRLKTKPIYRNMPKKRGRPKKVQQIQNQLQQSSQQNNQNSQMQNQNQQAEQRSKVKQRQRPTGQNRKTRLQKTVKNVQITKNGFKELNNQKNQVIQKQYQKQKQHPQKQLILQRVKFCINKRDQLIEYLDQLIISTNIIQDILNLDVTTIILQGQITQDSLRVLQKLRSAILHKYFPDDIKIRKKYEKTSKKIASRITKAQQEQTLQDLQLRRKTIIKLQKILRNADSSIDQKQKAIQIQSYFRKYDQEIGNAYKTIAYKVLRSLKDKLSSVDQVLLKLQNGQFQEQDKDK